MKPQPATNPNSPDRRGSFLHLFEGYGIEMEYMIVDAGDLSILPAADRILSAAAGEIVSEVARGEIAWSNELVLHVIELKTNGPAGRLAGLAARFQESVREINDILAPMDGRLMPTAAHPWMDPIRDTRLWPHQYSPIYAAYDRIFGCRGHGWSNLQSVHVNLPFFDDAELGRLHAAIRLVLPIMPALTASSPILDGAQTPYLDARMEVYRHNSARIPSVTGRVIPEPVYDRATYEKEILAPMYRDVAPLDPEGVLQEEFLNARGAIARFERNTIEIRVLDIGECPMVDLAAAGLIISAIRGLVDEQWQDWEAQKGWPVAPLANILPAVIRDADRAVLANPDYLRLFGYPAAPPCTVGDLWAHIRESCRADVDMDPEGNAALDLILSRGPLARRILGTLAGDFRRERLAEVYGELCGCLADGRLFTG